MSKTHLQSYAATTSPEQGLAHLLRLRKVMAALGLDGFIVPHEDEHQNEYLPDANERLAWISGFTGSAGAALILMDEAFLFADGRYSLQARTQTDSGLFEVRDYRSDALAEALAEQGSGTIIGYDPRLHSPHNLKSFQLAAYATGVILKATTPNPLDQAWGDERPAQPMAPIVPHSLDFAGISADQKRHNLSLDLKAKGLGAALITAPSSLAWLFNIRGGDVIRSPLPLGQAIVFDDGRAVLFVEPAKLSQGLPDWLGLDVAIKSPEEIYETLSRLNDQSVLVDPVTASAFWVDAVIKAGAKVCLRDDPCSLPRAMKNAVEIKATTKAHRRDGAILTQFLYWLKMQPLNDLPTEIEVAQKLEAMRQTSGLLKDLSFDTISAFGPHGALPHYRVTNDSNLRLAPGHLMLVDSGGQYEDGTTDVTRTVAIGTPRCDHKRMFTLVLKGHIALAKVRFPAGTTGSHLDALARQFLWAEGFDYDHGTGHGVGVYLGVHEGPQRISKALNRYELQPGMIVSNEPGYYKANDFGIRIENLQYVTKATEIEGFERPMLGFECLTWAPLDRDLIEVEALSASERAWVDSYHAKVYELIAPLVPEDVQMWLIEICRPL
jgi:Xaa-Pro aminopeptidase